MLGSATLKGKNMKHFISLLFVAAIASVQSAAQEPVCPEFITIGPFQQTSTASREVLKNSTIDARCFSKVDYVVQILGSTPVPGTSNVFVSLFGTNDIFDGHEQQSGSPKGGREEYQELAEEQRRLADLMLQLLPAAE